jgi:hypothetical protein
MIGVKPIIFPSEDYFIRRAGKCKGIKEAAVSLWKIENFIHGIFPHTKVKCQCNSNNFHNLNLTRPQRSTTLVGYG